MTPLVSLVTPSLNQGRFIRATIESVLRSGYDNLEYIVMDGGSTDGTASIAAEYASRLTFVQEADRGQAHAINKGFARSKGDILAWINSDDTIEPGAIAHAVRALADTPDAALVYGNGYLINETGSERRRFPASEPFNLWKLLYVTDYVLQQTCYFRRSALEAVDWLDESLHYALDWDLLMRLGRRQRFAFTPEYLGSLREYPEAKSFRGGKERLRELTDVMKRNGRFMSPPGIWQYTLVTYGDKLPFPLRLAAHVTSQRIVNTAQGLSSSGWASRRLRWALPTGAGQVIIQGEGPVALRVGAESQAFEDGPFAMRFDAHSPDDHLEFDVIANRRWKLRSIDWVR